MTIHASVHIGREGSARIALVELGSPKFSVLHIGEADIYASDEQLTQIAVEITRYIASKADAQEAAEIGLQPQTARSDSNASR